MEFCNTIVSKADILCLRRFPLVQLPRVCAWNDPQAVLSRKVRMRKVSWLDRHFTTMLVTYVIVSASVLATILIMP